MGCPKTASAGPVSINRAAYVRDNDDGDAQTPREILHQLEDLRLDGHVERRGRLVGNEQLGIAGETNRDHDALPHAAGELVRILLEPALGVGDANEREKLDGARARLRLAHLEMHGERFHDLQPDGEHRVQRGHRLLKDHRDLAPANAAHFLVVEVEKLASLEAYRTVDDPRRVRRQKLHHGKSRDRFARAGLADDRHDLAGLDRVTQSLDGTDCSVLRDEVNVQIVDRENWRAGGRTCGLRHPRAGLDACGLCDFVLQHGPHANPRLARGLSRD